MQVREFLQAAIRQVVFRGVLLVALCQNINSCPNASFHTAAHIPSQTKHLVQANTPCKAMMKEQEEVAAASMWMVRNNKSGKSGQADTQKRICKACTPTKSITVTQILNPLSLVCSWNFVWDSISWYTSFISSFLFIRHAPLPDLENWLLWNYLFLEIHVALLML